MSIQKKIVAIVTALSCFVFLVGPGISRGQSVEELLKQIAELTNQLNQLKAQLGQMGGGGGVSGCTISSFTRTLRQGMSGEDVKCLQIILNSNPQTQVASSGAGSPGNETTYFGLKTKAAVIKFQELYASDILTPLGLTKGTGLVGSSTRAKLNSLLAIVPPPTTECISDADCATGYICSAGTCVVKPAVTKMSVALASDNPPAANLWKGSANNTVLKLTFYGGDAPVTITGLTLTNYGTTESTGSTDLSAIKIFDEFNVQQGVDRTMTGNKVYFTLVPAITVPANGSKTISVAVNVGSGANTMAVVRLGVTAATDISGATFTGNFPLIGNPFTIVPAGSIGTLTVADFGSLPLTTVRIGQKDVVLEKFSVSAGANEDVEIRQITIKNDSTATISDSDISNIRVREVGGAVIAGPGTLSSRKVTLNLTTPYTITKGTSKNLEVIADIVSGATSTSQRTVRLYVDTAGVVGQGKLSAINMTSTGSTTATTVTIYVGAVSVSMSSNHPQGANALFIKTANRKTLAVFSVKAIGENVTFNTIKLNFNATNNLGSSNYLSNVGLYVDDALISDLLTVNAETDQTFTVNWTLPADTTKDVAVQAATNTMGTDASYSLVTTWSEYSGYGLSSGETLTSGTDVTSTAVTIYPSGKVSIAPDTTKTPADQGILAPLNNVVLGTIKVYAQREDQKLTDLVVTATGTNYDDENDISSLTLYDATGTTALSNPVPYDDGTDNTVDTFTFDSGDFLEPVIFKKGEYTTLVIKGNLTNGIDGTTAFYLYIQDQANHFKTEGVDSGTAYDLSTDINSNVNLKFSSPYEGGEFAFDTCILEVKKAADSPSGTLERTSSTVVAVWDIVNKCSDQSAFDIDAITFTTKTGWDPDLTLTDDNSDETYFKLYDGDGNLLAGGNTTDVDLDTGIVTFTKANMLTVNYGEPKQLKLVIDLTNTTDWTSGLQIHMTIAAQGDLTSTVGLIGYGGEVWSIPADANIVKVP